MSVANLQMPDILYPRSLKSLLLPKQSAQLAHILVQRRAPLRTLSGNRATPRCERQRRIQISLAPSAA